VNFFHVFFAFLRGQFQMPFNPLHESVYIRCWKFDVRCFPPLPSVPNLQPFGLQHFLPRHSVATAGAFQVGVSKSFDTPPDARDYVRGDAVKTPRIVGPGPEIGELILAGRKLRHDAQRRPIASRQRHLVLASAVRWRLVCW